MLGKVKRRLVWCAVVAAVIGLGSAGWWFVTAHKLERRSQSLSSEIQDEKPGKAADFLIKLGLMQKSQARPWDQIEPDFIALGKETAEASGIADESQLFKAMLGQLKDEKSERRILAAAALVYLDDVDAMPPLMRLAAEDADPGVRTAAAMAVVVIAPRTDDEMWVRKRMFERIAWPGGKMNFSDAIYYIC
ncbi:MAG: HEAT repeat domain-containing protein, partial [Planctomycetes bacterium]|nr:HEAT repeat domain-containing protein [Planctomycetota bacterium]